MPGSTELLRNTLNEWACLYGRKQVSDGEFEVWLRIFSSEQPRVLANALQKVTREADRMPTPGVLTKAIARAKEELNIRGNPVLRYVVGKDGSGVECVFWSDEPAIPAYRAIDCKEGRNFLAALANLTGRTPAQCAKLMEKWVGS